MFDFFDMIGDTAKTWGDNLFSAFDATKMNLGFDDSFATKTGDLLAKNADPLLRYKPEFAWNQSMQDYLAPLQHERFIADTFKEGAVAGPIKAGSIGAAALGYEGLKGASKALPAQAGGDWLSGVIKGAGTGNALTSAPSFDALGRVVSGLGVGAKQWNTDLGIFK